MAYSLDLKTRIINYVENGGSVAKAARIFQVGRASIMFFEIDKSVQLFLVNIEA